MCVINTIKSKEQVQHLEKVAVKQMISLHYLVFIIKVSFPVHVFIGNKLSGFSLNAS